MAVSDTYESTFDEDASLPCEYECPECSGDLRRGAEETTCTECGLVVAEHRVDYGPEWHAYEDDESSKARTGPVRTPARHDRGLSTRIGTKTDAYGNQLSAETRRRFTRLRRKHRRANKPSRRDRSQAWAFTEIRRIAGALDLSTGVRDRACQLFRAAQAENLLHGRSLDAMAAASVYAACRCLGYTRTLDEIAEHAKTEKDSLTQTYRVLNVKLELPAKLVSPVEHIPRLASQLDVSAQTRYRALTLARRYEVEGQTSGRKPAGIAAACLYVAAREHQAGVTQDELADLAGVAAVTLRARRDELAEVRVSSVAEVA